MSRATAIIDPAFVLALRKGIVACLIAALAALPAHGGSVATDGSLGTAQTITPSGNIFTIPQSLGKTFSKSFDA